MSTNNASPYQMLLQNNREWVAEKLSLDADYFTRLAEGQAPSYLFIGCSDSRVPAETITGASPGEMFVHRNIANQVIPNDINCMAVLQFSIEVLGVRHIIVCGHYGCGGVKAAMNGGTTGVIDHWLSHIRETNDRNAAELTAKSDEEERHRRLVELNVIEQVRNVARTSFVRNALEQGKELLLHGWVFDIANGTIHELEHNNGVDSNASVAAPVAAAS